MYGNIKIDKHTYELRYRSHRKVEAIDEAKRLRKEGYSARVVKRENAWFVAINSGLYNKRH